jgi:hypothetical protein
LPAGATGPPARPLYRPDSGHLLVTKSGERAKPLKLLALPSGIEPCRVAVGGTSAPAFYFKLTHVELILSAAGLHCGQIDQPPDVVAARLEKAAESVGAVWKGAAEIRKTAERQVDKIIAEVKVAGMLGDLKQVNRQYRAYRLAKGAEALPYSAFLERRYTATIVQEVAASGRMI